MIEDDLRGPLISATVSERCHSFLRPLAQGLAFLSSLQASREAKARQKQEMEMAHVSQMQGLLLAVNDFWLSGKAEAGMGANRFGLQKVVVANGARQAVQAGQHPGGGAVAGQGGGQALGPPPPEGREDGQRGGPGRPRPGPGFPEQPRSQHRGQGQEGAEGEGMGRVAVLPPRVFGRYPESRT